MLKRLTLLAALGAMTAACASEPAPTAGAGTTGGAVAPATPGGVPNALNIAGTSHWVAEERLMPQDPILALVNASGTVDNSAGFAMTCNPANGTITARLGKQPTTRVGQSATYRIRMGAEAKSFEGKFETNPKSPEADFVFPVAAVDLNTIAQLDMVSALTDQGEVQWAFVRDPATQVQARYIGSLKDMAVQTRDYLTYCNPK
ncbi:MAG: hypothetical protein Q8R02_15375 [Hyphomonadaceae bacterium]|nr:hypothetical protein [Hyphomonadaceae bacterium]